MIWTAPCNSNRLRYLWYYKHGLTVIFEFSCSICLCMDMQVRGVFTLASCWTTCFPSLPVFSHVVWRYNERGLSFAVLQCLECLAKCLHCVRTACALRAHCVHIAHAEARILTQEYLSPVY